MSAYANHFMTNEEHTGSSHHPEGFNLATLTAQNYLDELIHYIENVTGSNGNATSAAKQSKRRDGMTETQASTIFNKMNSFFTLKWPHVIALLLSANQSQ